MSSDDSPAMESIEELLVSAVNRCDKNTISCLLAQGANANVVCASGRTALGFAAEMGNIAILKMLLEVSSVSSSLHQEDEHGQHQQKRHKGRKSRREHSHDASGPGNVSRGRSRLGRQVETVCDFPLQRLPANSNSPSDKDSEPNKNNLGYFIVVHNDGAAAVDDQRTRSHEGKVATALNDIQTPDGMEKLEWDSEMDDSDKGKDMGDDAWASLYRWYADILDRTSSLLQLPQNRDINQQDTYGRCAVHYAAEHGHVEALRLLRAAGCRMDVSDTDNFTPLHLAASRDHYHVVQLLLDAGVEVNRKTSDKTSALHIAASRGFVDTVWVLIDHGASIDSLDASDRTPLMLAVSRGHEDVVALLIKHGAKVNIEEIHGYTPLCEAVWQKLVPLVQLLLDAGAKITQSHYLLHYAVMHRHIEMARLLIQAGSIVNLRDDNGDTPLIVAARTGVCELAKLLLENGASVNYPNSLTGSVPLHEATEYIRQSQYGTFELMFNMFRSYGALLNVRTCTGGDTPLFRAILLERDKAAALLIRHGTDVNMCDVESCVVDNLTLARKRKNFPLVRMIVYAGFDLQNYTNDVKPVADTSLLNTDTMKGWLTYMKYNPMRLTDLCRILIRKKMGEKVYEKVSQSYLPYTLKRFLLLEDIETV
ncbi:ankyrin repeat, PH and SEC7 domain containing protein secG isoform X2 [Anabrus simplex]|uniref:ankyrin repeat, PH and SEC7 domain containing protein secG isoform X2 n=1 Tax=Anabrus simplex TaxID=316456 RepID=UPI0035A27F42